MKEKKETKSARHRKNHEQGNLNGETNGHSGDEETSKSNGKCSEPDTIQVIKKETNNNQSNKSSKEETSSCSDNDKKDDGKEEKSSSDQEFIFIHDTGFTVKIAAPGLEPFDIQVIFFVSAVILATNFESKGEFDGVGPGDSSSPDGSRRFLPSNMLFPANEWHDSGQL